LQRFWSIYLTELPDLQLLEYLHGAEDAGVDDAGDGEGSAHDGADGGQKVVERRPLLVVPHGDRVQVKPEPECWDDPAPVTEGDV